MRRSDGPGRVPEDAVLRLVQDHAGELLRFAHRFSHCADDAHDAYQRSLEILVRRMRVDPPSQPLKWVRTVLRHEALAIRAQREEHVSRFEVDFDRHEGLHLDDPAERAVGQERLGRAAEALQRLKPQELTALVLRAEGLTYKEICARTGWSYTRCNRAVTEGRRALTERFTAIESGAECDRWAPLLSALADGEATAVELAEVRPHLRACAGCRATLRTFHAAPAQVAALVPAALVPLAAEPGGGSLLGHVELALHALAERTTLAAMRLQGAMEGLTGGKLAAVAASTAAIAGGGAAIEAGRTEHARPDDGSAVMSAAPPSAPAGPTGLVTIADPLPRGPSARARPRDRRAAPRREFGAPDPTGPSEFAPRTVPAAEFASAGPPPAAPASAAVPVAPPPPATPSEFGGP